MSDTEIVIEPFAQHPGYIASVSGRLADGEVDPQGVGLTRVDAATDLARHLTADAHPAAMLAVAVVLREDLAALFENAPAGYTGGDRAIAKSAYERAIRIIEGI